MPYKIEKKSAPGREAVEVLESTFEEGKPEAKESGRWRQKLASRAEKLKYLEMPSATGTGKNGMAVKKGKNQLK